MKKILIIFLCYFVFIIAWSQNVIKSSTESISTFNMFRDPSYFLFGSGIGNMERLMFEADIVPYFMLSINKNVKWGIELSPRIILRMYNQYSHPVRTPSFMPKITGFYQFIDKDNKKRNLFTYFSWFHHSNGQDGYFYNSDSLTINTKSGSFFTNWIEGGVFLSRPDPNLFFNTNYVKLYAAYSYLQEKELNGIYGRLRFYSNFQSTINLTKIFGRISEHKTSRNLFLNQSIRFGWIAGNISNLKNIDKKRILFQYAFTFKPSFLNNVFLYAQYNYGQDYYNIYFNRNLNVFRFGIASKVDVFN